MQIQPTTNQSVIRYVVKIASQFFQIIKAALFVPQFIRKAFIKISVRLPCRTEQEN